MSEFLAEAATVERVMRQYGIDIDRRWFTEAARDVRDCCDSPDMTFERAAEAVAQEWLEVSRLSNWELFVEWVKGWFRR